MMKRRDTHTDEWKKKFSHGKLYGEVHNRRVDKEVSNRWLTKINIFPGTESFMTAI